MATGSAEGPAKFGPDFRCFRCPSESERVPGLNTLAKDDRFCNV